MEKFKNQFDAERYGKTKIEIHQDVSRTKNQPQFNIRTYSEADDQTMLVDYIEKVMTECGVTEIKDGN